jgi:predicted nucleotidyltransferase component of viral defense system
MSQADSVKDRLRNIARVENKSFDYLLMLYMIERLLYRLSISRYSDDFVLKGGLLLYTILDERARVTKDIDLLARDVENTVENILAAFGEICAIEVADAVRFDIGSMTAERIKEDAVLMEFPSLLDMEKPKIKAYSRDSVVSEKFLIAVDLRRIGIRGKRHGAGVNARRMRL